MQKPVAQWSEQDLQDLVDRKVNESGELEYKRSAKLVWANNDEREEGLNDLSKHISALANSNGGLLIIGIEEDRKTREPERVDDGLDPATHSAEWLERIIRGNIKDAPPTLHVQPIRVKDKGRVAYVVEIPMFPRGCQARDGRYYRRRDRESKRIDDWEVRELMSRAVQGTVALTVCYARDPSVSEARQLLVTLRNVGTVRIHDWAVTLDFPVMYELDSHFDGQTIVVEIPNNAGDYQVRRFRKANGGGEPPLFPDEAVPILKSPPTAHDMTQRYLRYHWGADHLGLARDDELAGHGRAVVRWTVYADDLPAQTGAVHLRDIIPVDRI